MNENELYAEQMRLWVEEHNRITSQLERSIEHYKGLSRLNEQQLELHNKRITISLTDYNIWATERGMPHLLIRGIGGQKS